MDVLTMLGWIALVTTVTYGIGWLIARWIDAS